RDECVIGVQTCALPIWVVRNEPRSEGQRGQGRGMLGLEQTQGVVLLRGQVVLRKELVLEHAEAVVRRAEAEIALLLRRIEAAGARAGHAAIIVGGTRFGETKVGGTGVEVAAGGGEAPAEPWI